MKISDFATQRNRKVGSETSYPSKDMNGSKARETPGKPMMESKTRELIATLIHCVHLDPPSPHDVMLCVCQKTGGGLH